MANIIKSRQIYQHEYYETHKAEKKKNYNSQTQYIQWTDAKKVLNKLKRRIGTDSYNLLKDEFDKLDKFRRHLDVNNDGESKGNVSEH